MTTISDNRKFITISEMLGNGLSHYRINSLVNQGVLIKINRFTYENVNFSGEENEFYTADAYVPEGIICLMSAARYYNLTNYMPDSIDVAINRKKKVSTLPEWPEIKLYYFDDKRMNTGMTAVTEDGNKFQIFDIEKTVVDIISYRNKVGIEEMSEVLKNYLRRENRNLDMLYAYARQLHCEKILRTYMEVLI